jgi:RNA recognition motif-containing protein
MHTWSMDWKRVIVTSNIPTYFLLCCRHTQKSRGIALARFAEPQSAVAAHAALDGSIFQGRLLHVLPGREPPPPKETLEEVSKRTCPLTHPLHSHP